ncbi:apoptosis-associated speck-like protein containing a CARD isoform X2 [Vanacampus margaritifer]
MSSIKMVIRESLENLSVTNLAKFRAALVDRRVAPRVALSKVEGKDYLDITNVLVSTFTEDGAPAVTAELLKSIKCNDEAKELDDEIAKLKSSAGKIAASAAAATAAGSAGAAGGTAHSEEEHFVDKHKLELIERVCNIKSILDVLQKEKVIQSEIYEEIYHTQPNQEKMRKIYRLALKSGKTAKDIFYECLKKYEPRLVADLERSE